MLLKLRGRISVFIQVVCLLGVIEETVGSKTGCKDALGMESGAIVDSQITASSSRSPLLSASAARLNNGIKMPVSFGAWCADDADTSQYLQIDLLRVMNITAISTQGFEYAGGHWVTQYTVSYTCDMRTWQRYLVNGKHAKFKANNDTTSVVTTTLPVPIAARAVRVNPLGWNEHGAICLRTEIHGCATKRACQVPTTAPTTTHSTIRTTTAAPTTPTTVGNVPVTMSTGQWTTTSASTSVSSSHGTEKTSTTPTTRPTTVPACTSALGMESGSIRDHQITASSYRSVEFLPAEARLNNQYGSRSFSFGAWCAAVSDQQQYIQIDLLTTTKVIAIATQGMAAVGGNWVTSYTLSYSCNGVKWYAYEDGGKKTMFQANIDGHRAAYRELPKPVIARLVRVRPETWNSVGDICLRLELYGCNASKDCTRGNITERSLLSTSAKELTTQRKQQLSTQTPTVQTPSKDTKTKTKKRKKITIIYVKDNSPENSTCCEKSRTVLTLICLLLVLIWSR